MDKSKFKKPKTEKDIDKDKKRGDPDGWLSEQKLTSLEQDRLNKVFDYITAKDKDKPNKMRSELKSSINSSKQITAEEIKELTYKITDGDLKILLEEMGVNAKPSEIKDMIWEVDEDMDKCIKYNEFTNMYKRCINDNEFVEPRKLFNLVQFLMFDKEFKGKIIEEQTLELLIIRYGRAGLDQQVEAIFGPEKTVNGQEKSISYSEYIEKVHQMALSYHKSQKEKKVEDVSKSKKF